MIRQYHLPLPQREAMGLEDFLPSSANEAAVQWLITRTPGEWPGHALILWGPEGSGKTHLLSIWSEKMGAKPVRPCDEALALVVDGAPPAAAFIFDDADQIAGDAEAEEWLQHFYNATKAANLPLLMAASKAPAAWGLRLRDIETRLKSCPAVELLAPDDELMRGLLMKLFADRQLMVDPGVVDYLAARLERTGTALQSAVAQLDEAALETGRKISVPFVQKTLFAEE